MNDTASQEARILEYLQAGNTLTPLEALDLFKCWRLGARVRDLRLLDHEIKTEIVKANGKRFARYSLEIKKARLGVRAFDASAAEGQHQRG